MFVQSKRSFRPFLLTFLPAYQHMNLHISAHPFRADKICHQRIHVCYADQCCQVDWVSPELGYFNTVAASYFSCSRAEATPWYLASNANFTRGTQPKTCIFSPWNAEDSPRNAIRLVLSMQHNSLFRLLFCPDLTIAILSWQVFQTVPSNLYN